MADTDEWGGIPVDVAPKSDDWGGIAIDEPSAPKIPDMSGVQKTAQANLAANDNQEGSAPKPPMTPQQRLDAAAGLPVQSVIDGTAKPTDINTENRKHYIKAVNDGTAIDSGDWMQSMLHAVTPIASDIGKTAVSMAEKAIVHLATSTPGSLASDVIQGTLNLPVQGITRLAGTAYEKLGGELSTPAAEILTQGIPKFGEVSGVPQVRNLLNTAVDYRPTTEYGKITESTLGVVPYLAGGEGSLGTKALGSLAAGVGSVRFKQAAEEAGFGEKGQAVAELMGGLPGFLYGAGGPWNDHPGSEPIRNMVAQKNGVDPSAVASTDIDHAIAQGAKSLLPPAADFTAVSNVSGIPEAPLKTVFIETGKRPEEVLADAQHDPEIIPAIEAGKVPDAYEHLVEPTKLPAEGMAIARDDATRSYTVVDAEGDHVQGGFDSAEEARHFIDDKKFEAEEREAIENEPEAKPTTEKTPAGEQTVIPGAEKISDKELAERQMEKPLEASVEQKPANEGIFDVTGHGQKDLFSQRKPNVVPPSEIGKPTSLRTFLSNNGAKFNEANELVSIKRNGERITGEAALEYANEIAKEHGYLPKDNAEAPSESGLTNLLTEKNGGREAWREQDAGRVAKINEEKAAKKWNDPAFIEHEAHAAGIDTEKFPDETEKQYNKRLLKAVKDFYAAQEGSSPVNAIRLVVGETIKAAEKFAGKLTGDLFDRLGEAYIKTFQPELVGPLAKRADAFMAKFKTAGQEAENAFYRQFNNMIRSWDKKTPDERMQWINDHETGRWNEEDDPDHAQFQSLLDASFKAEKEAIGADPEKGYKENYLPLQFENEAGVRKYFNSEAMIRKYGADWFTKARTFDLIQDAVRAGFKLKTDNPGRMLVSRLLAGDSMMRTMDLLKDMEGSGIAKRATAFSIDKKIAKTEKAIADIQEKYKKELADIEKQKSLADASGNPIGEPVSKKMQAVQKRIDDLNKRLADFNQEKAENKLTPDQMKALKIGFRVIGPDSKAWIIHQEAGPLWKNAMEMKGLWENQGITGDAYRAYIQGKAIWTQVKLGLSLFHPVHVAMINVASQIAGTAEHLIHGGKLSDLALGKVGDVAARGLGVSKETSKLQDHPAVQAWNTAPEARTPEQQQMVSRMIEGGFKPTMSARDTVHFRENFDKAINGVGLNNLRLIGTAASLPGLPMKPFFEHWIPGMKSEIYLRRYQNAIDRDPSLLTDAGRRGEMARQIAKDTDRTYGEMNNDVQFWNRNVRDSFNAAFISGGWKLAQIYNARGLLQPGKIAYKFAKTGEFSKADITYNMLHAYAYTGLTLALGGAINAMLGNPIGKGKDTVWDMVKNLVAPQTGEKNPDGTPIRLNQPAFAKEAYAIAHDINTKGLIGGTGEFLYHQTLIPSIINTLTNRDFTGREQISDPTDLHQWMNAGWDAINPIAMSNYEKAETKGSDIGKVAGVLGFPMAGAYLNQTPFEQKIIAKYDEQNPPKGDAYQAKLKADMRSAVASHDVELQHSIAKQMKKEGMTEQQIEHTKTTFKTPFAEFAWTKLSATDQKHLISSASDEEKKKFKIKGE